MRRSIATVVGCTIQNVRRPPLRVRPIQMSPGPRSFRRRAIGRRITAVRRLGKRVFLDLDSGDHLVIEPRMSGLITLADPPDRAHLRVVLELSDPQKQLIFWDQRGLGVVRLVSSAEFEGDSPRVIRGPASESRSAIAVLPAE